ncbi:UNVERIFIED_CONTAM: hypothetical protein K2H54_055976 [Gekko kuhli]
MPAAAGDGLLSEPPAASFGDSGGEPTTPPLGPEGSFLAAWVNAAASRERLREFQHIKRVGNYLIGRKLGEGSFAKVREGMHVVTGEKVHMLFSFEVIVDIIWAQCLFWDYWMLQLSRYKSE